MSIVLQGSTSGSITLQEPAVAGSTVLDLPATSGTLITTGSTGQVIPKAALPTGSVLQVVTGTYDSTYSSNSTSFVDLISLSITPTSASSKMLIYVYIYAAGYGSPKVLRNSTAIVSPNVDYALYYNSPTPSTPYQSGYRVMYPFQVYDSPATTSSITYKLQIQGHNTSNYIVINPDTSNNYSTTSPAQSLTRMTIMEISA